MVLEFNLSGTLNALKLLWNPKLCLPKTVISNFGELTVPLHSEIKAVVLDKDNCFAYPHDDKVWPEYDNVWKRLLIAYPDSHLLIVSNTAGTNVDAEHKQAQMLEANTGVHVLRHATKKPGCKDEVFKYFYDKQIVKSPSEIAIVGDRLFTDIVMANMMGSYSIWIKDGVKPSNSPFVLLEHKLYDLLNPGN
ncbi:phosphatidylglycerophosphatase Ecym_1326 [Eremothecium cymbalariae DBVPG|uniref:Phosphatidylglycerophosphatase GEP4, mitochondrial n=1 Tax=Eremothecium cymbalariae (strain CBS 270.75 / DBVPG 7215 / KCTC 17166 / NRRL Y-17582) TaxID=931890 RepID=G8JN97_ERECY|nr:hypothetical protein Ecym_1326 [Eremothecium cymbalariae DBVPG\